MSIIHLALIRDLVVFLSRKERSSVFPLNALSRLGGQRSRQIGHSIGGAELCFFFCWLAKGGHILLGYLLAQGFPIDFIYIERKSQSGQDQ